MRDIIVTIPKSTIKDVEQEEREVQQLVANGVTGIQYYWRMGTLPKSTPRRIFFVWDGAIRAYHLVTSVDRASRCVMMGHVIYQIQPIPMAGFQGFRYVSDKMQQEIITL